MTIDKLMMIVELFTAHNAIQCESISRSIEMPMQKGNIEMIWKKESVVYATSAGKRARHKI